MISKIQQVFRDHFDAFSRANKQDLRVHKAAVNIKTCRSSKRGGHIKKCPHGHVEKVFYNSCRHRACPLCAFVSVQRWIRKKVATLPDCDYFHVVFTIPDYLHDLWRYNREAFTRLFFEAAWHSLKELLETPKHLGATPGAIAALHTWGQTLWVHPHLHFLVTGGGLTPAGVWKATRRKYLVHAPSLCKKFRGKLRALCLRALERGDLVVPEGMRRQQLINALNKFGRKNNHIRIMEPYRHGRGVVTYLGRYARGGPVSDRRIEYDGHKIVLHYKDNQDLDTHGKPKRKTLPLTPEEFLRRFAEHVPPTGLHVIRSYGLLAPGNRAKLNAARAQLGQLPYVPDEVDIPLDDLLPARTEWVEHPCRCPVCGALLVIAEFLPRDRSPPRPPLRGPEPSTERPAA